MFDLKADLGIRLLSPDGDKKVSASFPSDADVIEWRRKKKIHQKDLGRRSFTMEPSKPEAIDLALATKMLRTPEGETTVEIDEAEAFHIINQVLACDVTENPEREGSVFVIRMKVVDRFKTVHVLRVPSMRDMMEYERNRNIVTFGQYGKQEIRINYRAAADLYDKVAVKERLEGYAGGLVPVAHKAEAVNVLLQEIRAQQEDGGEAEDGLGE